MCGCCCSCCKLQLQVVVVVVVVLVLLFRFASLGKQQFYIAEMREYIEEHQLSGAQLAELLTHRHHLFAYHINFFVDLLKE